MKIDLEETGAADEQYFEALADDSRRRVLSALFGAETSLSLTELAIELVEAEIDPADVGVESDRVERRVIDLYHRHVPKLADIGLVEFDADRRTVELATEFDDVDDTAELLVA